MGGEHHADPVLGDHLHEHLEELAPGQGVQAGHRLVEEEELGPLGDGQREGQLGPLAAGERSRPLAGVEIELLDAAWRPARRPSAGSGRPPMRRCSATDRRA